MKRIFWVFAILAIVTLAFYLGWMSKPKEIGYIPDYLRDYAAIYITSNQTLPEGKFVLVDISGLPTLEMNINATSGSTVVCEIISQKWRCSGTNQILSNQSSSPDEPIAFIDHTPQLRVIFPELPKTTKVIRIEKDWLNNIEFDAGGYIGYYSYGGDKGLPIGFNNSFRLYTGDIITITIFLAEHYQFKSWSVKVLPCDEKRFGWC